MGTYQKEFRTLKAMLNVAVEWDELAANPIGNMKGAKTLDSMPPHYYTKDELQNIYDIASVYPAQWQFLANTGLRRGEALQLDIKRDVGRESIRVVSMEGARTKSGKWRDVPLFDGARDALERIEGRRVFPPVHRESISRAFRRDIGRVELSGSLHSLRHTFASHLAMSGRVSLQEVKVWMGHSSITTTQQYQHLIPNYRQVPLDLIQL